MGMIILAALGGPPALKWYSLAFFLVGFVLLTAGFASESEADFVDGTFLLRIAAIVIGIMCVAVAAFLLILELFIRL